MGFLDKLKLLFVIQKPAGEVIDAIAEAKKTKKWIHFAVTILSIATASAATWSGYMDPKVYVVVTSLLSAIYNIVRGADKADNSDVKGAFTASEVYNSIFTEVQKFVVSAHTGGVDAAWLGKVSSAINLLALMAGQNLAARAPDPTGESKGLTKDQK